MIWLIGRNGMLGSEVAEELDAHGLQYVGTDRDVDITDFSAVSAFAERNLPQAIVNCAAYTAVEKAEDDGERCRALNVDGVANIARAANSVGARLIHISTDYVFHGNGSRPYREDDPTDPIGVYGLTKRDGELAAFEANPKTWILRTAWLYGKHGPNFVFTMLKIMREQPTRKVVNDQRGTPTSAKDLARAIRLTIEREPPFGIYHFSGKGEITWYDFAREIYRQGREIGLLPADFDLRPCSSGEFPAKVQRPAYSVLDKTKIETALGIQVSPWKESLARFLTAIKESEETHA